MSARRKKEGSICKEAKKKSRDGSPRIQSLDIETPFGENSLIQK
jgi:hypothetical protein